LDWIGILFSFFFVRTLMMQFLTTTC
jgi:hypothetical protein